MSRRKSFQWAISRGFTIVELLVVVAVLALLMALLLPSLVQARYLAEIAVCGSTLRQYGIADMSYATDAREFPNSAKMSTFVNVVDGPIPLNPTGEHGGFAGRSTIFDGVTYKCPVQLLTEGSYTTDKGCQCPTKPPGKVFTQGGNWMYSGNVDTPYYCYIGPAAMANTVGSNGSTSGLSSYGLMIGWYNNAGGGIDFGTDISNLPEQFWGVTYRGMVQGRAMACCPSLERAFDNTDPAWEPHMGFADTTQGLLGQLSEAWHLRRRNYLYTDGHVHFENVTR